MVMDERAPIEMDTTQWLAKKKPSQKKNCEVLNFVMVSECLTSSTFLNIYNHHKELIKAEEIIPSW